MMHGDVTVESEPGQGSTFTIRPPADTGTQVAAPPPAPAEPSEGKAGTVLVIDDDAAARDLIRRFLESEGFGVAEADAGEPGLALARALKPAAITLDVLMPGMDGWAVLSALKAEPELAGIPVIMLTMLDDKSLGFALGASEYLSKPVDRERLRQVLRRYRPDGDCDVLIVEDDRHPRAAGAAAGERGLGGGQRGERPCGAGRAGAPYPVAHSARLDDAGDGRLRVRHQLAPRAALARDPGDRAHCQDLSAEDRRMLNGDVQGVLGRRLEQGKSCSCEITTDGGQRTWGR
jgi:CheY-like chemotaxis protein